MGSVTFTDIGCRPVSAEDIQEKIKHILDHNQDDAIVALSPFLTEEQAIAFIELYRAGIDHPAIHSFFEAFFEEDGALYAHAEDAVHYERFCE